MEQAVSRRKKIIVAPTYDDSRAKIALWNDPQDSPNPATSNIHKKLEDFFNLNLRQEGNILFNNVLNTFYLRLYGVGHMVKDHSNSERGNPMSPHGLFFPISSNGYFICIIT